MARTQRNLLESAQLVLESESRAIETTRARLMQSVVAQRASGSGDIDHTFGLDRRYRLVLIRCHFAGGSGHAPLVLSVDAATGSAFDARLFTWLRAGTNRDVHLRIAADEATEPSPWTLQAGDRIRVRWINPHAGTMQWGLEVGLAPAS